MTATERGHRSDALYYAYVTRRELCDMIASRESRIEELEAAIKRLEERIERG